MQRRRHGSQVVVLGTVVIARTLLACGGDEGAPGPIPAPVPDGRPADARCLEHGTDTMTQANHGHILSVSEEDVAAGIDRTYNIRGSATHDHLVTITGAQFAMLAADDAVMGESSVGGDDVFAPHLHQVTVMCD